jgi:hypothetical protein
MGLYQDGLLLTFENRAKCMVLNQSTMPDMWGSEKEWNEYWIWKKKYDEDMEKAAEADRILNYGDKDYDFKKRRL